MCLHNIIRYRAYVRTLLRIWTFLFFIIFFRFVDVGVYGVPKTDDFETVATTRRVESFVRDVKG